MNSKMKTVIVIVIAVAIIVPVSIVAYSSYVNSQDSPLNYIPSNTTFLVKVTSNGSTYYAFGSTQGLAIMLSASKAISVSGQDLRFNSTKIPISIYGNYGGFTIYNISLSSVIYGTLLNLTNNSVTKNVPMNSYLSNLTSFSLYLYEPYSNHILIGSLKEVKYSINSYNSGKNFLSKSKYIDNKGTINFYISLNSTTIWGNYSSNTTYLFVQGNHTFITNLMNESSYLSLLGYKIKLINSNTVEIIIRSKISSRVG